METRTVGAINERWGGDENAQIFGSKLMGSAVRDICILLAEIDRVDNHAYDLGDRLANSQLTVMDRDAKISKLKDAALEIQPKRLAEIETQMQVSCQARAAASRVLNDTRQARKEETAAECHKETAAALRRLAEMGGER